MLPHDHLFFGELAVAATGEVFFITDPCDEIFGIVIRQAVVFGQTLLNPALQTPFGAGRKFGLRGQF